MKEEIVESLVCPVERDSLHARIGKRKGKEILEGQLVCPGGHCYLIEAGIPNLIPLEIPPASANKQQTEQSFSAKWRKAPEYRRKTEEFYRNWYLQRYGFGHLDGLRHFLKNKFRILDAGTGTGRDSKLYSEISTAQVFGIDVSEGIQIAYEDLRATSNLHLIRADLTQLPFKDCFFDFVSCDQVIHHTPNPRESLRELIRVLEDQAHIAFYVYKRKGPIREFCDDYFRKFTTEMTEEECLRFSEAITKFGQTLSRLRTKIEIPEDIPLASIKSGTYDLQRFFYWNVFKCFWNEEFDFVTNVIINFDWYHPKNAFRFSEDEIRGWCTELDLSVLRFDVCEPGISVLARKGS